MISALDQIEEIQQWSNVLLLVWRLLEDLVHNSLLQPQKHVFLIHIHLPIWTDEVVLPCRPEILIVGQGREALGSSKDCFRLALARAGQNMVCCEVDEILLMGFGEQLAVVEFLGMLHQRGKVVRDESFLRL